MCEIHFWHRLIHLPQCASIGWYTCLILLIHFETPASYYWYTCLISVIHFETPASHTKITKLKIENPKTKMKILKIFGDFLQGTTLIFALTFWENNFKFNIFFFGFHFEDCVFGTFFFHFSIFWNKRLEYVCFFNVENIYFLFSCVFYF